VRRRRCTITVGDKRADSTVSWVGLGRSLIPGINRIMLDVVATATFKDKSKIGYTGTAGPIETV